MQVLEAQRRTFQQFLDEESRSKNKEIGYDAANYAQYTHPVEVCSQHQRPLVKMLKTHKCPWTCPESGCGFTLPLRKARASKVHTQQGSVGEERVSVNLISSTGRVMPGIIPVSVYQDLIKFGEITVELVE